jgi:hypothetical protein
VVIASVEGADLAAAGLAVLEDSAVVAVAGDDEN